MTHNTAQSSGSSTPAQEPLVGEVVVLRIDHVGSVAHLQDAKATKRMRAIQPKKYMAIIDKVSFLYIAEFLWRAHLEFDMGRYLLPSQERHGTYATSASSQVHTG